MSRSADYLSKLGSRMRKFRGGKYKRYPGASELFEERWLHYRWIRSKHDVVR
jgi:hypothetical protein